VNIKSRLKKLESAASIETSEYCECYEKHWRSEIDAAYNDNPDIEMKVYPQPDFAKDSCDICGKRFSEKDVEMNRNFEEIYGEGRLQH
jgi:hypothetical protein